MGSILALKETADRFKDKRVVILAGGDSREREVSFRSAQNIKKALANLGINSEVLDFRGENIKKFILDPPDVAFLIMHGKPGEDGSVQGLLELFKIPYTGSGVVASAVGIDKYIFKLVCMGLGINVPPFTLIRDEEDKGKGLEFARAKGYPVIVKPRSEGSSVGTEVCYNEQELKDSVERGLKEFGDIIVEKFIKGKEVTVGILGSGRKSFALPILELRVKNREFYDYTAKYTKGETEFIIPATLPQDIYGRVQDIALRVHRELDCKGFSRVDFIVADDIYALEINTIPGMTDLSDLPAEAKHMGITYEEVVLFVLRSAYE